MVSAGAATGQRLVTMVPSAQLSAASKASPSPGESWPLRIKGRPRQTKPEMPRPRPRRRRRSKRSPRIGKASSVAQIGMVKVRIAAREVGAINWAKASRMLKAAIERKPAMISRGHCSLGTASGTPRASAIATSTSPAKVMPAARSVQGAISVSDIRTAGQLKPQSRPSSGTSRSEREGAGGMAGLCGMAGHGRHVISMEARCKPSGLSRLPSPLAGEDGPKGRMRSGASFPRHGRACPDHSRLRWSSVVFKTWMLATRASMTGMSRDPSP